MKGTGRNDPCPCGSGKKYKKCCLARRVRTPKFSVEERWSAFGKLLNDLREAAPQSIEEAAAVFWGPYRDFADLDSDFTEVDLDSFDLYQLTSRDAFYSWLAFDYRFADGRTAVESFLDAGPQLSPGERAYLEQSRSISVRLYEVVDIRPGSGLSLRDVVRGDTVFYQERLGSRGLHQWDLIAVRAMPTGASGHPELEGGLMAFPYLRRVRLAAELEARLQAFRERQPGVDEREFFAAEAPRLHQAWLQPIVEPQLPELKTSEGEEVLFTEVYFDVLDEARLKAALDNCEHLEREDEGIWSWYGSSGEVLSSGEGRGAVGGDEPLILFGGFELRGDRLVLNVLSKERAAKGRALIEEVAGDAVRHRLSSHQHPHQSLGDLEAVPPREALPDGAEEMMLELYEQHYRAWLDDEIPALDGVTPRTAAKSALLRPKLVELLKDLEHGYEKALSHGEPGFDPSWMWAELGLDDVPEAPTQRQRPPLTGYESMELQIPGIEEVARKAAERFRHRGVTTFLPEMLSSDLQLVRFLRGQATAALKHGSDQEAAAAHGNLVGAHLDYMCNYELHHRKTFWVDESLAWMLGHTELDRGVTGELLRLPFTSFAVILNDRYTLSLAERLLSLDPTCELRGRMLQIVTIYVTEVPAGSARGLKVAFLFDALAGQWPYLFTRDLYFEDDDPLAAIVDSHFPDVDLESQDPLYSAAPLRRLLQLLINTILYATSAGIEPELRSSPASITLRRRAPSEEPVFSSVEVYYLPGTIDISHLRQMQAVERAPSGRKLMHRFMVRGHWRRANPSWADQRPRWIKPYWKGPDIAATIERAYRLQP